MQLLSLTVENLGVFRGRHDFNLMPTQQADSARRHLTIITGHNGSGKTTLFQAMTLALHGPLALGDRVTRQEYSDFLLSRLHRRDSVGSSQLSEAAGVTLSFEYVQSGQPIRIQVERQWRLEGKHVTERLSVLEDGKPPDVKPEDYQTWLHDLVPVGVAPLCFFNAERLDALASLEQYNGQLGEVLRRLLSLDLVERLQSDLQYYRDC